MLVLIGYYIAVNVFTMYLMAHDKSQARKHGRRVPERTLFLWALIGGAAGGIAAMRIWRHKTKHASFVIGMPAILIAQAVLVFWYND
ncbi:DUF1294 domain-containing protein [Cohnella mopanensis]|uniref:DUF1294 domain-containing protein n=1 Tax=Cohnella mopanensis TaxID=2911966 RepID=UPI001EF985CA|nr:DUF1294 domain-containing protein [Cohnella mopanensis]